MTYIISACYGVRQFKMSIDYLKEYVSDYNLDGGTICGKVWYEKNTNIGVMCCKLLMKFVRLQYLNPDAVKK